MVNVATIYSSVRRGVSQGSILEPLLFILYSADNISGIRSGSYYLLADDLQLYVDTYGLTRWLAL